MKKTILSHKTNELLEEITARHGRIVTFAQIREILSGQTSDPVIRNRVALLTKLGWLIRIKRGLFVVMTDVGSRGANDVSLDAIAQAIKKNCYISFERALQYHGLFDQMIKSVGAVTFEKPGRYRIQGGEIRFFSVKKALFFGFSPERSDLGSLQVACIEKAMLDLLYFNPSGYAASLVWEKLRQYRKEIDFDRLKEYASKFNYQVIRQTGFFLDRLGIPTGELERKIQKKSSFSRMTPEAKQFNSKWRLYFDDRLIDQNPA
ncbi:MAG TPA: type IV toxin-antitoxin system AbiEi family antitoxin [Candidatus Omnitrophota bacterium]|nr:type IV toxin-antitoxin system AbiEi family antitoxin [Candidatus Omnitrophota bacterium]